VTAEPSPSTADAGADLGSLMSAFEDTSSALLATAPCAATRQGASRGRTTAVSDRCMFSWHASSAHFSDGPRPCFVPPLVSQLLSAAVARQAATTAAEHAGAATARAAPAPHHPRPAATPATPARARPALPQVGRGTLTTWMASSRLRPGSPSSST
jgi:hypothetical protein